MVGVPGCVKNPVISAFVCNTYRCTPKISGKKSLLSLSSLRCLKFVYDFMAQSLPEYPRPSMQFLRRDATHMVPGVSPIVNMARLRWRTPLILIVCETTVWLRSFRGDVECGLAASLDSASFAQSSHLPLLECT
jgi:hypothetical protein